MPRRETPADPMLRRTFLGNASFGLGSVALAGMFQPSVFGSTAGSAARPDPLGVVNPLHFPAKAKRVIFLCMAGGPSHLETFDEKPELARLDGQPMPASYTEGQPIAQLQGKELLCWGPRAKFARHGQSGLAVSDYLPNIASVADELCIVRSMVTEQINHDPAHTFMNTGTSISGRPSMGAWVNYGLGSECDDLPGFVVLTSRSGRNPQPISSRQWHSGFLPSKHQGVPFHSTGDPVHYIANPEGVDRQRQTDVVDAVNRLNRMRDAEVDNPEIRTRIAQYELAAKMQLSVPGLTDIADEPQSVLDAYGVEGADGTFAYNCLLARRLAERGVRFVHLYHRGWDHHDSLKFHMGTSAKSVDQPTAALIRDLKQRGMLEDTLVVWGGEFGRTPMAQGAEERFRGRDHHIKGFSMMLAGAGIRPGHSHGATDDLGYNAVEDVVHVHDFHATMLHLLGIDHERLTYRYQGRDFRLTDVHGRVVKQILA
ncbi:MAG: DUF1501 domain-containing protein [Planctomycetota bacterium]